MRKMMVVLAASIALLSAGCSTAYRSSDFSLTGGFSEIRLAPDSYRVLVEGNSFTMRGEVEQFLLRRCAELTLEQGKRYFVLADHEAWIAIRRTKDGVVRSPRNEAVMTAMEEKTRDAFDAVTIIDETNEVANGKLSARAKATLATFTDSQVGG